MHFETTISVQDKENPIVGIGGNGFKVNVKNTITIQSNRSSNIMSLNLACHYNRDDLVSIKIQDKNGNKVADFVLSFDETECWIRALETAKTV